MTVASIFDWTLIGLIAACAIHGFARGVFRDLWSLCVWLLTSLAGLIAYEWLLSVLGNFASGGPALLAQYAHYLDAIALFPAFLAWLILFILLQRAGQMLALFLGSFVPPIFDGIAGALSGVGRGILILLIGFAIVQTWVIKPPFPAWTTYARGIPLLQDTAAEMMVSAYGFVNWLLLDKEKKPGRKGEAS